MVACRPNLWRPSTTVLSICMAPLSLVTFLLMCLNRLTTIIKYFRGCKILFNSTCQVFFLHRQQDFSNFVAFLAWLISAICNLFSFWYRPYPATWWRHQMETFSALLAICAGNSPVPGEFLAQRPVTRSFDVFFDLRLNKRLSKQPGGWWFETLSRPSWRHRNDLKHLLSLAQTLLCQT